MHRQGAETHDHSRDPDHIPHHHEAGHAPHTSAGDPSAAAASHATQAAEELGAVALHGHPVADAHAEHAAHAGHMAHTTHAGHAEHAGHAGHAEHAAHAGHAEHAGHAGHSADMFKRPFWISLILTLPVLYFDHMVQSFFGFRAVAFPGAAWIAPVLASIIYWYGGWVFLSGAWAELRRRQPGMMTLVALAITTAYFYSLAVTFGLVAGMPFYWELATLVTIMLLGHWLELRAVGSAQNALRELARLLPDTAERIVDGRSEQVPVSALRVGDLLLVRPGGRVPADGVVESGESELNESMVTGESRPVRKQPGAEVIAGTVNGSGALRVRVTRIGEETMLSGIMRLVQEAQTSRSQAQALADRAAAWLTYIAIAVALLALIGWGLARGLDNYTLERVVSTLVVACPHALGLAIPLVIAITTTLSARNGILVRNRLALEQARLVDVVVFDKTGTLTRGEHGLVDLATQEGVAADEALALAAAVERDAEHMIARALVRAAQERSLLLPEAQAFQALPGRGVQAQVAGRRLRVGGPRLLEQEQLRLSPALAERARLWGQRGQTVVYLVEDQRVLAAFALADVIRPESRAAVRMLRAMGKRVAMLTGDSEDVARWVAAELGIDDYFAQVLPEHKHERIKALQRNGAKVAMVGDGVNDAPALAQADVGIAIGAGTDVARAAADIVLVRDDPRDVARVIRLSAAAYRKMVQNLAWAVGYNVIALPLAAGALAWAGVVLPPAIGALLMSLSTIIVAINAQTLRRLELRVEDEAPAPQAQPQPA
ncbi:heavy metal translocating P-type ATPase [Kallotenue papyrolyticum]|uniref:heavy metal translocating P-type ATPase n=1 Tax=Kallotenue papyrolyticum TaxID=1325125 RepID=UPI0004785DEA|nr:heavy metal translocating P-type ATPase [Kallotenue papyrolyticum]